MTYHILILSFSTSNLIEVCLVIATILNQSEFKVENLPYNLNWQIAAGIKNVANLLNYSLLTRVWPIHILLWLVNIKNERTCETSWSCFWTDFNIIKTIMSSSHFSGPSWAVISDWPFDRYTKYQLVVWFL